jgi:hypothetical protein
MLLDMVRDMGMEMLKATRGLSNEKIMKSLK